MRESSSESDDVELESNYSSSENDDDIKGCYMNEPEYLEKEINAMNILENEISATILKNRTYIRLKSARKSSLVLRF